MNILTAGTDTPEVNDALAGWAAERIFENGERFAGPYSTMGIFDGGELIAVTVYHNYSAAHGVIEMSAASSTPRWLTRPVLWNIFAYPFLQLGCQMVVVRTDPENKPLQRLLTSIGFGRIRLPNMRGRGLDEMLCLLTDEAWGQNRIFRRVAARKVD